MEILTRLLDLEANRKRKSCRRVSQYFRTDLSLSLRMLMLSSTSTKICSFLNKKDKTVERIVCFDVLRVDKISADVEILFLLCAHIIDSRRILV